MAGEIHLRRMKSLLDEIPLRGEKKIEADFISSEAPAEDFIRANREDFIVWSTISFPQSNKNLEFTKSG